MRSLNSLPGIEERHSRALADIIRPVAERCRISLFGSRARGSHRPFSDLDLLAEGPEPIPLAILARVETELSESSLPIKVDLVDARRASPQFLAAISAELIPLELPEPH